MDGADGHSLFYRLRGAGPDTIVIVHGFQGNNQNYLAADLAAVIVEPTLLFYDQRGGGRSAPVPDTAAPGLSEHVRDLEAVRTAMGFSQLTLLAHSGGAFIAAQYALQFPERVDRLILVAPGSPVRDPFAAQTVAAFEARLSSATWDRMNALRASLPTAEDPVSVCHEITSVMLPGAWLVDPSTVEAMRGAFCAAPDDILRTESIRLSAFQESLGMWDWRSELASLEAPVLIIHGDQDAIPRSAAEEWEKVFGECAARGGTRSGPPAMAGSAKTVRGGGLRVPEGDPARVRQMIEAVSSGLVVAVSMNPEHTLRKPNQECVRLLAGLGVEGDAHLGKTVKHRSRVRRDPTRPNLRQVHLVHSELLEELRLAVEWSCVRPKVPSHGDYLHLEGCARRGHENDAQESRPAVGFLANRGPSYDLGHAAGKSERSAIAQGDSGEPWLRGSRSARSSWFTPSMILA